MSDEEDLMPKTVVKGPVDLQRLKIEKLMKNPEKLCFIPEKGRDKKFPDAPEFVRNVMGSSAGAGSGEFHVYRHIRRREYARQEFMNQQKEKELSDIVFQETFDEYKKMEDAKTAKKRAKRQKRKAKIKEKRMKGEFKKKAQESEDSSLCSDDDEVKESLENDSTINIEEGTKKETDTQQDKPIAAKKTSNKILEKLKKLNQSQDLESDSKYKAGLNFVPVDIS